MTLRKRDPYDGPLLRGIDVSAYQGWIDWPKVAASGVEFTFCRAYEGLHADHTFSRNYVAARAAGVVPGAYAFVRPALPVVGQAHSLLAILEPLWRAGDLCAIDVERGVDGTEPSEIADRMLQWIAVVESALGRVPVVYAGAFYAAAVHDDRLGAFPLWTPSYGDGVCMIPRQWDRFTFRQTSGSGHCPGVSGAVDTDVFRGDSEAFRVFRGG